MASAELTQRRKDAKDSQPSLRLRAFTLIWVCWIIVFSWLVRYWINQDVIGSLDSARFWRAGDVVNAINITWGTLYSAWLALLPLETAGSWFLPHLLVGGFVLGAQGLLYATLRHIQIRRTIAFWLAWAWAITCFSTGGALFLTADSALVFMGTLFLYAAIRWDKLTLASGFGLGILHALSAGTKTVALLGMSVFPIAVVLGLIFSKKWEWRRLVLFGVGYAIGFLPLIGLWGVGTMARFGRFALGDSGAYNYQAYVATDGVSDQAVNDAIYRLPQWGTYYWSDLSTSLPADIFEIEQYDWDAQFQTIRRELRTYFLFRIFPLGLGAIPLLVAALIAFLERWHWRERWWLIGSIGLGTLVLYVLNHLESRFIPFFLLFFMPSLAYRFHQKWSKPLVKPAFIGLVGLVLLHGFLMMGSSVYRAPNSAHFDISQAIRQAETVGLVGSHIEGHARLQHYAVIAHLIDQSAAQMIQESEARYAAGFEPMVIVLTTKPDVSRPEQITVATYSKGEIVGENQFESIGVWQYVGSSDHRLTVYRRK